MKKVSLTIAIAALVVFAMASCGNKSGGSIKDNGKEATALPEGYKTFEFANFSISVPEEFTTSYDANSEYVRFNSEAVLTFDDGEEYSSSATIDAGFMSGGGTPSQIKEIAETMKLSQEATGETCDEPVIDGNTILMRHYHESDYGGKYITWRWWVVSKDGKNISGNIAYPEKESKFYDGVAKNIVKTIKIK